MGVERSKFISWPNKPSSLTGSGFFPVILEGMVDESSKLYMRREGGSWKERYFMNYERVLIAEADAHLAEVMVIRLSNSGYQVAVVDKGDEVLAKAISFDAGIVVLDQFLPLKDGFEVCLDLKMNPKTRGVGILLLSEQEVDLNDMSRLGIRVDGQLVKPFKPKDVLNEVNRIIAKIRARQTTSLTGFSGWEALKEEIRDRLISGGDFDLLFITIDNFRVYNKTYGFEAGDEVLLMLARIMSEVTDELETPDVFLCHIIANDFAIMLPGKVGLRVGEEIIKRFDEEILGHYLEDDRERGGLVLKTREGKLEQWPLMSLSLAVVSNLERKFSHPLEVKMVAEELLEYIKVKPGSNIMVDRRKE